MRSLRDRLKAVTSAPPAPKEPPKKAEPFFMREAIVPMERLRGVELVTLDEIRACDPAFTGDCWNLRELLFLDTETTGLSGGAGTVAFEIGVGFIDWRGLVIRQYVMRDYGEEGAMLADIAELIERHPTIVSFNGKSFDLPLLESRMIMNRIRMKVTQLPHFDLLHACRRVYKLRLGRCNLATLEEAVLGQGRDDDLPGAQVPQRYFDYLKTHEFALLEDVLRHNFQDVQSLAELTGHLCAVFRQPEKMAHPEDIFGVGRTLLRTGRTERGRECLRILGHTSMSSQAHMHLAASYRHERDWRHTVDTCLEMIAQGEGGAWPYVELAKFYEHTERDYRRALSCATGALRYLLNTAPICGEDPEAMRALQKRIARLQNKIRKEKTEAEL